MGFKNVMIVTSQYMASVENEALKMASTLIKNKINCDIYYQNKDRPEKTKINRYDLGIWWTPLLLMYLNRQKRWINPDKCNRSLYYYVIEGKVMGIWSGDRRLKSQEIIAPSNFVKQNIEDMGFKVKEVIPHQIDVPLPIDYYYGFNWRSKLPKNKKILLYNGSQIVRKGLWLLATAIKLLSQKRNDFVMVYHTDNLKQPYHTPIQQLMHQNSIIQTDFPHLQIDQVYAKMFYSDFIIHPAITEGFGLPVLEALALGKPIVTINTYGIDEIATPDNSFMVMNTSPSTMDWKGYIQFKVKLYDPRDLADMIDQALDSPKEVIDSKKAEGYETVKSFQDTYKSFIKYL